jgi:hypothetical protein
MDNRDPLPQPGQAGTKFVTIQQSEIIINYEMRESAWLAFSRLLRISLLPLPHPS